MFQKLKLPVTDRPEIAEIFADSMGLSLFDNGILRLEFCVTRMDPPKSGTKPTRHRYTAARLALTPEGALELINQIDQFKDVLKASGLITDVPRVLHPEKSH